MTASHVQDLFYPLAAAQRDNETRDGHPGQRSPEGGSTAYQECFWRDLIRVLWQIVSRTRQTERLLNFRSPPEMTLQGLR